MEVTAAEALVFACVRLKGVFCGFWVPASAGKTGVLWILGSGVRGNDGVFALPSARREYRRGIGCLV